MDVPAAEGECPRIRDMLWYGLQPGARTGGRHSRWFGSLALPARLGRWVGANLAKAKPRSMGAACGRHLGAAGRTRAGYGARVGLTLLASRPGQTGFTRVWLERGAGEWPKPGGVTVPGRARAARSVSPGHHLG